MEIPKVRRLTPEMRNELRKQQTRAALLEAAAAVFAARGFHAASLDEIADAAGYTKGAIYSNFGSKEELFLTLVQQRQTAMLDQFFPAADPDNNPDPAQQFAAVTDVYRQLTPTDTEYALWLEFQLYALRHPDLREHMRERQRAQFAALVELLTHHLAAAGVTDPPIPVQALAQLYTAVFDTLARERALDPDAIPDNLFATLTTFINDSIQHPPNQPRPPRKRTPKARS